MQTRDANSAERKPLLDWVLAQFPDTPRKRAKEWVVAGRVSVGGVTIRKPHELLPDPRGALRLQGRHATSAVINEPWHIHPRVAVVYIDPSLAIVDKGADLLAVSARVDDLSAQSILADFLAGTLRTRHRVPAVFRQLEPLPVHRLDQFTTGLLCLALNPGARARLIEQFSAHTITREYIAFADGAPKSLRGTWRHWLQLGDDERVQQVFDRARPNTVEAITHYEVLAEFRPSPSCIVTKLRLKLETGRRHQIRVQAAHERMPLIGDRTYHPLYHAPHGAVPVPFERQALHAEHLGLTHPESGQPLLWTAPLPRDLQRLEAALRRLAGSTRSPA